MKKVIIHPLSINPVCKTWSREKFIRQFSAQFPDHDIEAYADSFGLVSEAVASEAPPASPLVLVPGKPLSDMTEEEIKAAAQADAALLKDAVQLIGEDTATSSDKTSKRKGGKK